MYNSYHISKKKIPKLVWLLLFLNTLNNLQLHDIPWKVHRRQATNLPEGSRLFIFYRVLTTCLSEREKNKMDQELGKYSTHITKYITTMNPSRVVHRCGMAIEFSFWTESSSKSCCCRGPPLALKVTKCQMQHEDKNLLSPLLDLIAPCKSYWKVAE